MATAGSIVVDLLMRTGSFETDNQRAAKVHQKAMRDLERQASQAASGMSKAFKGILTGAVFGIGISSVFSKFITETRNAQGEQAQLAAALASTGEAAGYSAQALNKMASELASSSAFSEGDINNAQTRLLSYTGVVGEQYPRALQAALDMSARLGTSLEQSAETIGKAIDVPSKGLSALSKQGFRFTEEQEKMVKRLEATGKTAQAQSIVLAALESSYGGAAEAARNTLGGALDALGHQFDSLMTGDDGSVNGMTSAVNDLTKSLGSPETKRAFADFVTWLADISKGLLRAAGDFAEGMRAAGGFVNALITYGTINPFNSHSENAAKYRTELEDLDALEKRVLAGEPNVGGLDFQGRRKNLMNRIAFSQRKADIQEADVFAAYNGYGETGRDVATMPAITVTASGSTSKKKGSKSEIDGGQRLIDQMNERIALIGKETEYEKLLARISVGSIKFRTEGQKQEALLQAQVLDVLQDTNKAYEDAKINVQELPKGLLEATDRMSVFAEQAGRNIQSYLGDGMYTLLKGNFDGIGEAFSNMLLRMVSDLASSQLSQALMGSFGTNGSNAIGGLIGAGISALGFGAKYTSAGGTIGGNAIGDTSGLFAAPKGFDDGGYTGPGGKFEFAGVVHKGEGVLSQEDMAALGGVQGFNALRRMLHGEGYSSGGAVDAPSFPVGGRSTSFTGVTVNIQGAPSEPAQVSASQDANGGLSIDLVFAQIERRIAQGVASGASKMNQAIERRYSLAPSLG